MKIIVKTNGFKEVDIDLPFFCKTPSLNGQGFYYLIYSEHRALQVCTFDGMPAIETVGSSVGLGREYETSNQAEFNSAYSHAAKELENLYLSNSVNLF